MKVTGRTTSNRRRSRGERMLLMAAAWAMAVALAVYAGPSRANAAVGNAAWGGSSPADGSVINQFTSLSVVWNDPDGDQFQNGGYKVRRVSDGKYLQYSNDPEQVWNGDGNSWSIMMNDGSGAYHLPFDAFLQESLQEEGEYEFSFFANEFDGTTANSNYHYGVRITLDKTPPHLSNAVINKDYLTFDLTEQPDGSSWQTTDFDVQVNGVSVPLNFVAPSVGSDTILIQLSTPVSSGDEVTVSYAGPSFADAAGNAVSGAPVAADNGTPGSFEGTPALLFRMQAGYALKAGEPIMRFTPSKSGADFIQFDPPNAASNPPGINVGAIRKTDFVLKDLTDDSVILPATAAGTSDSDFNVYRMYWGLPSPLQEGHEYELAMSGTAGGDELTLPAVPTSEATASLQLQQSAMTFDEYEFDSLELPEVYLTGLAAAVSEAQNELDDAVEGTANGQYAAGAKAALQAAIDEAAAWLDSPGATQAEIDQALEDLEDALAAFGSKRVFVSSLALREAIETAQDLYDSAVEGTSNGQYAAGAKAALQTAIDEAAAWLDSPGATQADIDQALEDLEDALEAFDSKRVFVNYFPLRGAIEAAQDLYDSAEEGTAIGQYKAGAKAALLAAINAAIMPFETPGSTQTDVDAALAALRTAVAAFEAERIVDGGPGGPKPGGGGGSVAEYPRTYPVDVILDPKTTEKLTIRQTLESDGRLFDTIELPENFAENASSLLHEAGRDRLTIEITPSLTEATDFVIDLSSQEAHLLAASGIALDIRTPTASLVLPSATLQGLNGPLTIRLSSIEGTTAGSELERRAKEEAKRSAGTDEVTLAGHSISIATNQPLNPVMLSVPAEILKAAENSGFYVEDGDETARLVRSYEEGSQAGMISLELDIHANAKLAALSLKDWPREGDKGVGQEQEESWQLRKLPYINGYEGGVFKPNADVTRAELAAILSRIIDGSGVVKPVSFEDISSTHWAKNAIEEVVGLGLMSGTADGRFLPDKPATRAELAVILSRLPSLAIDAKEAVGFPDTAGHWAEAAIRKTRAAGLMNGFTDGTFKPDRFLSRAEAVVILNKLIGLQPESSDAQSYADVPSTSWAFHAIQAASIQ